MAARMNGFWTEFPRCTGSHRETWIVCASFYSGRGSHYWYTPEAGGKVDKNNLTQFGQALKRLGVRNDRSLFARNTRTKRKNVSHASGTPTEGMADMAATNRYVREVYMLVFNAEFTS